MDATTAELMALERRGWDALCDGTGDEVYGALMTDGAVMVLADGQVLNRAQVLDSLARAPTWDDFELHDARLVTVGDEAACLVYHATARRDGDEPFTAVMTSTWVLVDASWRLAVYTQTPA